MNKPPKKKAGPTVAIDISYSCIGCKYLEQFETAAKSMFAFKYKCKHKTINKELRNAMAPQECPFVKNIQEKLHKVLDSHGYTEYN